MSILLVIYDHKPGKKISTSDYTLFHFWYSLSMTLPITIRHSWEGVYDMFGERLKTARVSSGHTQQSLGELINVEPKQIWRWESDKNTPDAYTIAKLAQALTVSSDYLIGLTDRKS